MSGYLSYPDSNCEGVYKEMPSGDIVPCNCLAIHDESAPGAVFANEADMEIDKELHKKEKAWAASKGKLIKACRASSKAWVDN